LKIKKKKALGLKYSHLLKTKKLIPKKVVSNRKKSAIELKADLLLK
jgi:hypothetical protein